MTVQSPLKTVYSLFFAGVEDAESGRSRQTADSSFYGKGIVSETIAPHQTGRVRFQGSWWSALCEQEVTLPPGKMVQVIGRQNITLLVQPL
ncbi:membrane protein implicated in regulation of membrane protease activity [Leptolyngbyaceae cyanobacterium JSC-12]|nr:membrane protein implicated in regulation of membrane protease activity [Leptolyngbyaceae cyanobacterium JSC-12]